MEYLWAPWRIQYMLQEKTEGCILCDKPKEDNDRENYILFRGKHNFIMLNAYPYNPAHLLIAPYRHAADLTLLTAEERGEHIELLSRSVTVVRETLNPGGFNVGANIGKVAGAGIDDHFHSHVVPRWQGDTNFVPVLSDIRVVPQALMDTYDVLIGKFQ
ncbi:MAG: HIT domain-containing protein [Dehalococcoidales bacterium]|nr:HIT domain-containing protein [Dehalococcoidales bacterium]